jgi:hypothetical protein
MQYFRFWLGRHVVHLGLAIMPPGMAKAELFDLFWSWSQNVKQIVERATSRVR